MRSRWIVAGVVAAIGLIWTGQGLGLLRTSSFMDGDGRWAAAGLALVVIGTVIGWTALRNRHSI